ncbi:hypothetical protein HAX54_030765, partial [Datura stramonium]|nr:hypothetical protein [Datura stramonium]
GEDSLPPIIVPAGRLTPSNTSQPMSHVTIHEMTPSLIPLFVTNTVNSSSHTLNERHHDSWGETTTHRPTRQVPEQNLILPT